ncbi:polyamine aminopropyltransferase [Pseudoponticoccus marisrubri]|uniref:Polyamine aminopropyltransferase n=1 Tax=Pseudoponticoccus marisrubri TaxID=1685382 RepID=A0A0W7WPG0_9RHOB|nr:polyamine aminopropyltransferase [Pseudoponticoccus marisrubri]KUF12464.1 spermidine synthase [Pseudoponticoccus marisrubri]
MTQTRAEAVWLLLATFIVAVAGLVYELIAATASSYLLGDSVRQFSLVIGVFLSSMGLGAWLSRFVAEPVGGFVRAQIALGVIGGFSAPVIFAVYAGYGVVGLPLYGALVAIGVLSGMEIPLIARVLDEIGARDFRFENVLTADYLGALVASLAFPLLVVPYLGLMSASLAFGLANLAVAGLSLWIFRDRLGRLLPWAWGLALLLCAGTLVASERIVSALDAALYEDDIILAERTPYQAITVTRFRDRVRLFLDQSIQFDSRDEHRYHEALVHPAMGYVARPRNVLILGGGDGMAAREVLRHDDVQAVTLVDLDPRVTELFRDTPQLAALNDRALSDPRVTIVNRDAWQFLEEAGPSYDVIIADLPDPRNLTLSKLYSAEFYKLMVQRLGFGGVFVTQSGSPLFARAAFWSIEATLAAIPSPALPGETLATLPYHVYVPSFGDWGFVMARAQGFPDRAPELPGGLRFLTPAAWQAAQVFGADTGPLEVEVNSIRSHPLARYYEEGWAAWFD